jgi:hypothetical protein
MDNLHIFSVDNMEQYLPHVEYHGYGGYIQSFCDSFSNWLFPKAKSIYFDGEEKQLWLNMINNARKLQLLDNQKTLTIKKMNWYTNKLVDLLKTDECNFDCYVYFLDIIVSQYKDSKYKNIEVTLKCEDKNGEDIHIKKSFEDFNFLNYISEANYLKRDYSNKILAYSANLAELYGKYFDEDGLTYDKKGRLFVYLSPTLHGTKAIQHGWIEW